MSPLCSYCGQLLIPFPDKPCWHCKKAEEALYPHYGNETSAFTTRPSIPEASMENNPKIPNYDDLPETDGRGRDYKEDSFYWPVLEVWGPWCPS